MTYSVRFVCLLLVLLIFYSPSFSQDEPLPIRQMSKKADIIITGNVTEKKSAWNDAKTRIYTTATLEVQEYLKGSHTGNAIQVTYLGGEVGDVGEMYSHMPKLELKEEVLLFLQNDQKNQTFKVLNGDAGKFPVLHDIRTKTKLTKSKIKMTDLKAKIKQYLEE